MKGIYHIIYWLCITLILFFVFGSLSGNYIYTFYFLTFFMPVTILTSWYFNTQLLDRYLLLGKRKEFLLYSFYTFVLSLDLEMVLVFVAFVLISKYDSENLSTIIDHYKYIPVVMYLVVIVSALMSMIHRVLWLKKLEAEGNVRERKISIRAERKKYMLAHSEILYIESMSDFVKVYLKGGNQISSREKISAISTRLGTDFIRIHRSYLVNPEVVSSFSREKLCIGKEELPISRTYKKEVAGRLQTLFDQV